MAVKQVVEGLYQFSKRGINCFLLDTGESGLVLIDAGLDQHAPGIEAAIHSIGRRPSDLTHILLTHAHPDHLGSATELARGTVPIALHPDDIPIARAGGIEPTMSPGPGFVNRILFGLLMPKKPARFPPVDPTLSLRDGGTLDIAGGLEVIHTPGHTSGHVVFLWKRDRHVVFAGDAAANLVGLNYMMGYDDVVRGVASLARLTARDFEVAVFGHGRPILSGASDRFRRTFGS